MQSFSHEADNERELPRTTHASSQRNFSIDGKSLMSEGNCFESTTGTSSSSEQLSYIPHFENRLLSIFQNLQNISYCPIVEENKTQKPKL
jgi:hypothetical protein